MTAAFVLPQPPLLSRATFDRADEIRDQPERMRAGWPTARVLRIDRAGRYPVTDDGGLAWVAAAELAAVPLDDAVFLGLAPESTDPGAAADASRGADAGRDLWAQRVDEIEGATADPRRGAHLLDADEAGLLATALGVLNWHATAGFSPIDGSPVAPARGGWVRRGDGGDQFPRTDPATITVIHDGADQVLLGRQASWPDGWYSTLAGFVEPGESLEQCVIREVYEEVGVTARDPHYLGSQPWPFPRSLMLGFEATADPTEPLNFLDGEIGDAVWFHRSEVIDALEHGGEWRVDGSAPADGRRLRLPGSISIARAMIAAWAYAPSTATG